MAWLQRDPSHNYHVSFRFGGKKFKRSLHTKKRNEAESQAGRIEDNIRLVERGILAIPTCADIPTFLLSDGKLTEKVQIEDPVTLNEMFDAYFAAIPAGNLEETTIYSMKIHKKHLIQHLGANIPVQRIDLDALQGYVANRQSQVAKRKSTDGSSDRKISGATIKKEIVTFRCLWNWALRNGLVEGPFPGKQVKYPKITEKPPFQTWQEIEKQINRGGLSDDEQAELWDSLFLSLTEVSELLDHVEKTACHPFVYPMVIMAAHTGARRSEIIRSLINDFQDDTVVINERKRVRGKLSTRRVPLSSRLKNAVTEWLKSHPGGQYMFCQGPVSRSKSKRIDPEPLTPYQAHGYLKRTLAGSKWEKLKGWHVLRHSFISNCACKAIDQRIIDSFVGHTTEEMRRRYTHLFPSAKRDAIKSVFG
jgi:integrase